PPPSDRPAHRVGRLPHVEPRAPARVLQGRDPGFGRRAGRVPSPPFGRRRALGRGRGSDAPSGGRPAAPRDRSPGPRRARRGAPLREPEGTGARMGDPLFPLGRIYATPRALEALAAAGQDAARFLRRHQSGDWSEMSEDDRNANVRAVAEGSRVFSRYTTVL